MGAADRRCGVMLHQNPWRLVGGAEAMAWASGWHRAQQDLGHPSPGPPHDQHRTTSMTPTRPRARKLHILLSDAAYDRLKALNARYGLASHDLVLVLLERLDAYARPAVLDRTLRDRAGDPRRR